MLTNVSLFFCAPRFSRAASAVTAPVPPAAIGSVPALSAPSSPVNTALFASVPILPSLVIAPWVWLASAALICAAVTPCGLFLSFTWASNSSGVTYTPVDSVAVTLVPLLIDIIMFIVFSTISAPPEAGIYCASSPAFA